MLDQLLIDMSFYAKNLKAQSVYFKCVNLGKFDLAKKIADKYNVKEKSDDRVTALSLAMSFSKNSKL